MMDPSKLDKMKVVELRAELTARGLDTRGVKVVLVDRLKAALEEGVPIIDVAERESSVPPPGTPTAGTPARRGRRTRSTTRSPSPVKKVDQDSPALETVAEENTAAESAEPKVEEVIEKKTPEKARVRRRESDVSDESPPKKAPKRAASPPPPSPVKKDSPRTPKEKKPAKPEAESPQKEEPAKAAEVETTSEVEEKSNSLEPQKMEVDEEKSDKDVVKPPDVEEETTPTKKVEKSSKKRSRSKSRSHSPSRSPSRFRTRSSSRSRPRLRSRSRSTSPSRASSRSNSPRKQQRKSLEPNTDDFTNEEDEPAIEDKIFGLSWYDSDLHLRIDPVSFNSAKPLTEHAFGFTWSGARTNYGVRTGKVAYEVRISEETDSKLNKGEKHIRGFRCGFSIPKTSLMLGESEHSFAYCHTGKKATNNEFIDYGKTFGLDDVIGCYLDLESTPCKIEYTLNGESLGAAYEFEKDILGEKDALFPHILTKGYEFQVNFADNEKILANVERPKRIPKAITPPPSPPPKVEKQEPIASKDDDEENWEDSLPEAKPAAEEKDESKENGDNAEAAETEKKTDEENKSEEKPPEDEKMEEADKLKEVAEPAKEDDAKEKPDESKEVTGEDKDKDKEAEPANREPVALLPGYELIALISEDLHVSGPQRPESRKECEVILMVGLPASGKTYWALKHAQENPDKRYDIIGPDALIDKMKIEGKPRTSFQCGKLDYIIELASKSATVLEEIAAKRRRNYILDQTNVFASCQRRKMKGFGDFKRIAVVCIPSEDELKRRFELKSEAQGLNIVKESALNKMKASFTLPSVEFGWFDEVRFVDLKEDEAKEEAEKYNEKGKKDTQSAASRHKKQRRDNHRHDDHRQRDDRRRSDFRGSSSWKNDGGRRGGSGNRWGPPNPRAGNWRDDRGYGGSGGGYDRRDNRYRGGGGGGGGQGWVQNNRRYDDRYRQQSGGRFDYGGGGGGGGGRDNRDRYDRDRNGSGGGRRDGGNRGGSHRDFRAGHRDNRSEDSRGGYERSSSKYSNDAYDYKTSRSSNSHSSKSTNNGNSTQSKWNTQQQNWSTCNTQQPAANTYWNYDQMQAYGTQPAAAQQWAVNSADPRQQQQWMNWWQQQGNGTTAAMTNTQQQQYWTHYAQQAYPQTHSTMHDPSSAPVQRSGGSRSDSKKS